MLEHGGRLLQAARHYHIPLADWLDLSTGINPRGWPVPPLPAACWQRLPEEDDDLLAAARDYYGNDSLLATAGSQAAIQALPLLRPHSRVGILSPSYAEHAAAWQRAGHQLVTIDAEHIDNQLPKLTALIIVNPNNPSGRLWSRQHLLDWHARLQRRGGWLIVDEAFIDPIADTHSLSPYLPQPGLIVLRSLGKFFGLAGIRCGFVLGEPTLLDTLQDKLGPWTLSHPTRYVASLALRDRMWQQATAAALQAESRALQTLLSEHGLTPSGGCPFFQWRVTPDAANLHERLARHGILTRLFREPASIRFGLPAGSTAWQRLQDALKQDA